MNILYLTQSNSLELFWDLAEAIHSQMRGTAGFYVADSRFFEEYRRAHPAIDAVDDGLLLKEWEIIDASRHEKPDMDFLKKKERELGDPVLWNALVSDRRIYLGKRATLEQDYRPRLAHREMLSVLQVAVRRMGELFDRLKPDAVVGFICVTIGEYLAYLEAKARGVSFINLRPTRIRNYFYGGESIFEPSPKLSQKYHEMMSAGIPEVFEKTAKEIIETTRQTHAMYEGVLPPSKNKSPKHRRPFKTLKVKINNLYRLPRDFWDCNFGLFKNDTHYRGTFYPYFYKYIRQPIRKKIYDIYLRPSYIRREYLPRLRYAFYPLHKEPEVTLLVYGRPYLNQIEVVRNIARSLPVDMKLIVKEHPACVGYRPLKYYLKLLDIPNVFLAPPEMESRSLVKHTELVCIISGSVGLEALIMKKPVIHFGRVPFEALANHLIMRVEDIEQSADLIREILNTHSPDEKALIAYISAVIALSVPVDFYSTLLGRHGVYKPKDPFEKGKARSAQVMRLATYITDIVANCKN